MSEVLEAEVILVGGGVAGLAAALLLAAEPAARRRRGSIAVLEQHPPVAPEEGPGLRVLALSPASRAILESVAVWQDLPAALAAPYGRMVVWQGDASPHAGAGLRGGTLTFDAAEVGQTELGHIVDHDGLRWRLWAAAARTPGIRLLGGGVPAALTLGPERAELALADGRRLAARLVIGADGADSWVRAQLGLPASSRAYGQRAIVAHLAGERPHEGTAFQRFLATGPVALLPLADGRSSLVWSCPEDLAAELLALPEAEFEARLNAAVGAARGDLRLTTRRVAFPLAASHTHRYTGARFALIGDAAHQVHPLAGQGINLGLLDAAALAETLGSHLAATAAADPGDPAVLRRYERWRKGDNLLTLGAMDGLHRLFTSPWPALGRLGGLGLGGVDRLPALKRWLADQAMGRLGQLPKAARPRTTAGGAAAG